MSSHIVLVLLLVKVLPEQSHLAGSVACARTGCGHLSGAQDGEQRALEKSLKGTKSPTTPKLEHDLGCTCLCNVLCGPQRVPRAGFHSHSCSHQRGGFRKDVPQGLLSLKNKSPLSSSKQRSRSAGCPRREKDGTLSGHEISRLFL